MELNDKKYKFETSDFWYDVFEGGYFDPSKYFKQPYVVDMIKEARQVMMNAKKALEEGGRLEEY